MKYHLFENNFWILIKYPIDAFLGLTLANYFQKGYILPVIILQYILHPHPVLWAYSPIVKIL